MENSLEIIGLGRLVVVVAAGISLIWSVCWALGRHLLTQKPFLFFLLLSFLIFQPSFHPSQFLLYHISHFFFFNVCSKDFQSYGNWFW
jgi:hypothetical protein